MKTRFTTFATCAALCSLLAPALAAPKPAPVPAPAADATAATPPSEPPAEPIPLAQALTGEARVAYDDAKLLLQNGDAAGAVAKFQRAYVLAGDVRLLWNIAACEKALRHYASANGFVARFLNEGGNKLSEDSRQTALKAQQALRAFYSDVTLQGVPTGARISVDGVPAGVTPLSTPLTIDLGRRQLRVDLDGYDTFTKTVDVPGATPLSVDVTLTHKKQTAALSVTTGEPAAVIALDGKVVGSDHWQGNVPAGRHDVRVTARDKKPYDISLELGAGSSRTLQIGLQDARRPLLWPWVAGGAAVALAASVGGYFLFKPNDARGPVPHGELGNVQLPLGRPVR